MNIYVVDAFTNQAFCGNQAGVALLAAGEDYPEDAFMQKLAAELKHSETVFVQCTGAAAFRLRYFTPEGEVDLCGHATIAAFTLLREEGIIGCGVCKVTTRAGQIDVRVEAQGIWMDMAAPKLVRAFTDEECVQIYAAYGLSLSDRPAGMPICAVSTGLTDILLPVSSPEILERAVQNEAEVTRLSLLYDVVGVHMFCLAPEAGVTAHCRNFAPRYAIPEESATGTSNGALTYHLHLQGLVAAGEECVFVQGEHMQKPSEIRSRLLLERGAPKVLIGGNAVLVLRCELVG